MSQNVVPFAPIASSTSSTAVDDEMERFRDKLPREDVLDREHAERLAELLRCAEAYVRSGCRESATDMRIALWRLKGVGWRITTAARQVVRARRAREQSRAFRDWRAGKGGA